MASMRIGILSRGRNLYSTERLVTAARQRDHRVTVIDTVQAARLLNASSSYSRRRLKSTLPRVDAIIPRIGASVTRLGVQVVHSYEARGTVTTAPAGGIGQSRDKLKSLNLMREARLPIPRTALVSTPDELSLAVDAVDGFPVVIKILKGTQGRGVILATNMATAQAVLSIFFRHGQKPILIQEFIAEANGCDLRLLIVGHRCVAAMQRSAPEGEFRANLHRGGSAHSITADNETERLALQAAALHRLGVAGVDIIPSSRGPLLLEVNSSPGLEGIENTTKVDVAGEIVRFLEREWKQQGKRKRRSRR